MYGIVLPGPDFEGGIPIVKASNCVPGGLRVANMKRTDPEIEAKYVRSRLRPGDIVISIRGSYGTAELVPAELRGANMTQDAARISPGPTAYPRWLLHVANSGVFTAYLEPRVAGATVRGINIWDLQRVPVPHPPLPTQKAIAAFLDRKTAAIDALIDKKQRLLDLLAEKRAALINQAVTKGLDPGVPMKDSGIPWIGEIPAHWEVKRLRHVSPQVTVGIVITPSKYYVETGVSALRSLNVGEHELYEDDLVYISGASNRLLHKSVIRRGDLVAVRTGQPGTTAVVDVRFDGANCIDLIIIRGTDRADSDYLCHFLNSNAARVQYGAGSTGAIQQHFNVSTAKNLLVCFPPLTEQRAIAAQLGAATSQIDSATRGLQASIERFHEYRQTLITAAVTGQLDVPEEAAA